MNRLIVTTCHQKGYDQYGPRMIDTFLEYWPSDISMVVVSEDDLNLPVHDRIIFENYGELAPEGELYKRKFGNFSEAHGTFYNEAIAETGITTTVVYNYLYDAIKWSHKIFAVFGVSRKYDCDQLIWIDADNYTFKKIDDDFLNAIDPGNGHMSYLGRDEMYTECSFLVFNKRHKIHDDYINQIVIEYLNGEMFLLHEWHDSMMWDAMREHFEKNHGVNNVNLSGEGSRTIHPFVNCILGQYMDHMKGPDRKIAGQSHESDYINK